MDQTEALTVLPYCPERLAVHLLKGHKRILVCGETGIGKSTLTSQLAKAFSDRGLTCFCINGDPGSPAFGTPGTVSLGQWKGDTGWLVIEFEAICSLDAGRFRLPLIAASKKLIQNAPQGIMIVDPPGVIRGLAGSELLMGLVQ